MSLRWSFASVALLVIATSSLATVPPELARLTCSGCPGESEIRSQFSPDEWQVLVDGQPLTKNRARKDSDSDKQREAEAFGIVVWPPQVVWDVLVDFDGRTAFMPSATKSKITKIEGGDVRVQQEIKILWERIRFSVINHVDPAKGVISWVMDNDEVHDIADTTGAWQVIPIEGGKHTLLMYRSHTDTGRSVPTAIESYLIKRSLPKMIDAVRDETARRGKGAAYLFPKGSGQ